MLDQKTGKPGARRLGDMQKGNGRLLLVVLVPGKQPDDPWRVKRTDRGGRHSVRDPCIRPADDVKRLCQPGLLNRPDPNHKSPCINPVSAESPSLCLVA